MSNIIRSSEGNLPVGVAKLREVQELQVRYLLLDPSASEIETEIVVSVPKKGFFGMVHYRLESKVTIRTRKTHSGKDNEWWNR